MVHAGICASHSWHKEAQVGMCTGRCGPAKEFRQGVYVRHLQHSLSWGIACALGRGTHCVGTAVANTQWHITHLVGLLAACCVG